MRVSNIGAFVALIWGVGFAIPGSPAHAQEVTEDWPQIVSRALQNENCETALDLIRAARATNDLRADTMMGTLAEYGACVPQDLERAMDLYLSAGRQGLREAYPLVVYMYIKGRGTPPDPDKARYWFRGAAISLVAIPRRERLIFMQLRMIDRTIPIELKREMDWVNALEDGGVEELFELALRVRDGDGFPPNVRAAVAWLFEAAAKGFAEARYEIARMSLGGEYDDGALGLGMAHLFIAAEAGYVPAQIDLASRFEEGRETRQSDFAAYVWLLKAQASGADVDEAISRIGTRLEPWEREWAEEKARDPDGGPYP